MPGVKMTPAVDVSKPYVSESIAIPDWARRFIKSQNKHPKITIGLRVTNTSLVSLVILSAFNIRSSCSA